MKFIKPFVLNEKYGLNDSVKEYTNYIFDKISNTSIKDIQETNNKISFKIIGYKENFMNFVSEKSYFSFPIKEIIINFKFKNYTENKVANASVEDVKSLERLELTYDNTQIEKKSISKLNINFVIFYVDESILLKNVNGIDYGLQHELHHAFERYTTLLKGAGDENNLLQDEYIDLFVKQFKEKFNYPQQIINYLLIFYYTSKHEVNARIAQLEKELSNKNITNKDEFLSELKKSKIYQNYIYNSQYNKEDYINGIKEWLTSSEEKEFVKDWNNLSDYFQNKVKPINKIDDIFIRYDEQIKRSLNKFKRKMFLASQHFI